ncbi:hypothetical protein ACE02B_03220 [Shewanella mangrovisoli]|uniref:hypothetical protein n=1 Tax=Shewanella mangrovisoli TaxID=2864211 RepID=UPI0035BA5EC3
MNFKELPTWNFKVEEVSANVYRVTAVDSSGRKVEKTGTDPDEIIKEVKQNALLIMKTV